MSKAMKSCAFALVASLGLAQGAIAETRGPDFDARLLEASFGGDTVNQLVVLDDTQMQETQGELWPFIFGVATVDLALATFFWGTYVPTVSGSGAFCAGGCNWPAP
jgi:hypothetical protein